VKTFLYLPSDYKKRRNTVVTGEARTGEISPKGLVSHTEDWEGRIQAAAAPSAVRMIQNPDGTLRPMTFREMVDRGYFIVSKGPTGVRKQTKGIR
jgi:hypothetical protein